MNKFYRPATMAELKSANYGVDITHERLYRVAYMEENGKLVVKNVLGTKRDVSSDYLLYELLARGGKTTVTVFDRGNPEFSFTASARCREDENYCKNDGISECLKRIAGLMVVCDGTDGFTFRLQEQLSSNTLK